MIIWRRIRFDPPSRQCRQWLLQRQACTALTLAALLHAAQSHAMAAGDAIPTMVLVYNVAQFTESPAATRQQRLTLCMRSDAGSLPPGWSAINAQALRLAGLRIGSGVLKLTRAAGGK